MKSALFRRIFILYVVVIVLAVSFVEIFITSAVRESYRETLRANLSVQISLAAKSIPFNQTNLDGPCRELKKDIKARVTIIDLDGRVTGDSDTDSSLMDNHLGRTEISQALLFETGMAVRHSGTMDSDFLYVAKKVTQGQREGLIRLAVPLREVDRAVNLLRMKIILTVVSVLLATWIFSVWQTDHLRRLLRQIADFSRSLARGEIDKRLFLKDSGEFNEIADNLTAMSLALQGKIAESEEEKDRLSVILRSVPDALLIIDARGVITLSSASAREFFGDITMTGLPFVEVVRNHDFSDIMDEVRRSLSPGMTTFRIDHPAEKYLSVRVSPLFYHEHELSGFVAVFHDITHAEKLEQVRKDFVANVSHELKTPITAIKGFSDTLLDGGIDDRENAVRFIQTIKSNSERINSLVDDLMTISRIELGVIRIEKSLIDIGDLFENVMEIFRDRAMAKGLALEVSRNPELLQVSADRDRLIQILTNLVDNAIKFTEAGRITVGTDREDGKDIIFVEDTGIGVPPKFVSRLGERFFRVDPGRSRTMGGTGLGLAIVKHLVKAHGWSMQVESRQGRGTKISIFI